MIMAHTNWPHLYKLVEYFKVKDVFILKCHNLKVVLLLFVLFCSDSCSSPKKCLQAKSQYYICLPYDDSETYFLQVTCQRKNPIVVLWATNDFWENVRDGLATPVYFVDTLKYCGLESENMHFRLDNRHVHFFDLPIPLSIHSSTEAIGKGYKPVPRERTYFAECYDEQEPCLCTCDTYIKMLGDSILLVNRHVSPKPLVFQKVL